jgi:hypothetical protein
MGKLGFNFRNMGWGIFGDGIIFRGIELIFFLIEPSPLFY